MESYHINFGFLFSVKRNSIKSPYMGIYVHVQVKRERAEREALGALPLYQRTIP